MIQFCVLLVLFKFYILLNLSHVATKHDVGRCKNPVGKTQELYRDLKI